MTSENKKVDFEKLSQAEKIMFYSQLAERNRSADPGRTRTARPISVVWIAIGLVIGAAVVIAAKQ